MLENGNYSYFASDTIKAINKIEPTANVVYRAGMSIILRNGFIARKGCSFTANLAGCPEVKRTKLGTEDPIIDEKQDNEIAQGINIYPNQSFGKLELQFKSDNTQWLIFIYSVQGRLIKKIRTDQRDITVDLSRNTPGMYLIKVNQEGKQMSRKLILK